MRLYTSVVLFLNCMSLVISLNIRNSVDLIPSSPDELSAEFSTEIATSGDCVSDLDAESIDGIQTRSPAPCNPLTSTDLPIDDTSSASLGGSNSDLINPENFVLAKNPAPRTNRNERLCPFKTFGAREYSLCDSGHHYDIIVQPRWRFRTDILHPTACM